MQDKADVLVLTETHLKTPIPKMKQLMMPGAAFASNSSSVRNGVAVIPLRKDTQVQVISDIYDGRIADFRITHKQEEVTI